MRARRNSATLAYAGVTHAFGDQIAVRDLSLEIKEGETVVLLGPSGCGKTTTLKMANGLLTPGKGYVYVFDRMLSDWDLVTLRRSIGYVVQQIGLYPHLNILENVSLVARIVGWDSSRIRKRAQELFTLLGLDLPTFASKYPKELSGGQAQRVGVARALMLSPRLLLMDEPFGALDPVTRRQIQAEFKTISGRLSISVLMVTHDVTEAFRLADRIAVMDEGRLVELTTPKQLRKKATSPFVRNFLAAGNGLLE